MTSEEPQSLIPGKLGEVCGDVRPVLREIFRDATPAANPFATEVSISKDSTVDGSEVTNTADRINAKAGTWAATYHEVMEDLAQHEEELKQEYAQRLSRVMPANIYKIQPRLPSGYNKPQPGWRLQHGLLDRSDLRPSLEQSAGGDANLWVRNLLARSSSNVPGIPTIAASPAAGASAFIPPPISLKPINYCEMSSASISMGPYKPIEKREKPPPPPPPLPPRYVICDPYELHFVNFEVGQRYASRIRLMNVTRREVRVSISAPVPPLFIELCGARPLKLRAGACASFKIVFKPRDIRNYQGEVRVRASAGRSINIPVYCYMQPPRLHLLVGGVSLDSTTTRASLVEEVIDLGARLLGDVHYAPLLMTCTAPYATFFIMTEDDWLNSTISEYALRGRVSCSGFELWPAWFRGGGAVQGVATFMATKAGLHVAALRVLSSTSGVRPITMVADSILFNPEHITIEAHEKHYDINLEGDDSCKYYLNLGESFPEDEITNTVQLVNHSSVWYSYRWEIRPWGRCSCDTDLKRNHVRMSVDENGNLLDDAEPIVEETDWIYEDAQALTLSPIHGTVAPRTSVPITLKARVPPSPAPSLHRAVAVLILTNIPVESVPIESVPLVLPPYAFPASQDGRSESLEETAIHVPTPTCDLGSGKRRTVSLLGGQMEVWWRCTLLRFILAPAAVILPHSLRVKMVDVTVSVWQTGGGADAEAQVLRVGALDCPLHLPPANATYAARLQLQRYLTPKPLRERVTVEAVKGGWRSCIVLVTQPAARAPKLIPSTCILPTTAPCATVSSDITIVNDTCTLFKWKAELYWWIGTERIAPCEPGSIRCKKECLNMACTCRAIRPVTGQLPVDENMDIFFQFTTQEDDGLYAALIKITHSEYSPEHEGPTTPLFHDSEVAANHIRNSSFASSMSKDDGTKEPLEELYGDVGVRTRRTSTRAVLVAGRVMAPQLLLRVLPCPGVLDSPQCKKICEIELKDGEARILRPMKALEIGSRSCALIRVINITPTSTTLHWDPPARTDPEDIEIEFYPDVIEVGPYETKEFKVFLTARRVCDRKIFVRRARLERGGEPIYLLVDAGVSGVEVTCEIPLGGDGYALMPFKQNPAIGLAPHLYQDDTDAIHIYSENDQMRKHLKACLCKCEDKWRYVPPPPPPTPPKTCGLEDGSQPAIFDIITEPPLSRYCECDEGTVLNVAMEPEPVCLQFRDLPLHKLVEKRILLRNVSSVASYYATHLRRWPLKSSRTLKFEDRWRDGVGPAGMGVLVVPGGELPPHTCVEVPIAVYADCWGVYHDQVIVKVHLLPPAVIDIWVEAVGPPLQLLVQPNFDLPAKLWLSHGEQEREVLAINNSRVDLLVYAFMLIEHDDPHDAMPFRLYLRFEDTSIYDCHCRSAYSSINTRSTSLISSGIQNFTNSINSEENEEVYADGVGTAMKLELASDCGRHDDFYYRVNPVTTVVAAGERAKWVVTRQSMEDEYVPDAALMLLPMPLPTQNDPAGLPPDDGSIIGAEGCWRPRLGTYMVHIAHMQTVGALETSGGPVCVSVCALDVPPEGLRVRKRVMLRNTGTEMMIVYASTKPPWRVIEPTPVKHPTCKPQLSEGEICLPPHSALEMALEVTVMLQKPSTVLESGMMHRTKTALHLQYNGLVQSIPLCHSVEYPALIAKPQTLNFKFVTTFNRRKAYFSVSHTSLCTTVLVTVTTPSEDIKVHPTFAEIPPRKSLNVYVLYNAKYNRAPLETFVYVMAHSAAAMAAAKMNVGVKSDLSNREGEESVMNWCGTRVAIRAVASRDFRCYLPPHDFTDDTVLFNG